MCIRDRLSSYIYVHHPDFVESEGGWLNNLGFHGLSEQLYEYTSCACAKAVHNKIAISMICFFILSIVPFIYIDSILKPHGFTIKEFRLSMGMRSISLLAG